MKVKRFVAPNMSMALHAAREELGNGAVILSSRRLDHEVEVLATLQDEKTESNEPINRNIKKYRPESANNISEELRSEKLEKTESTQASSELKALPESTQFGKSSRDSKHESFFLGAEIADMNSEIKLLRGLLERQMISTGYDNLVKTNTYDSILLRQLSELGLSVKVSKSILQELNPKQSFDARWKNALLGLESKVKTFEQDILDTSGIIAMVGPTGVGKTTTIAKLAARFVLKNGANDVALLTTDSYRIAAYEQLQVYAKILAIPIELIESVESLRATLWKFRDKKLILIDTAGMSQRDVMVTQQLEVLRSEIGRVRNILTLSATSQLSVMNEAAEAFKRSHVDGCIITKLDESSSLGEVITTLIEHDLPVAYVTTGQGVPDDIARLTSHDLILEMVSLAKKYRSFTLDKTLAYTLGSVRENEQLSVS